MRNENGAGLLLETLLDEGVTHLFGNPGTTELPLMDALVNEERLEFILTLHEGVAISAAEGYGLSTGKTAAINLHVEPG
ncbi:MAG: thiamine pyrophosphate-binding protein, partial [Nitrospinae bacterium]|nr:thiamine pyrophosphate-binding protein [Nitrospinota bacterium]